MNKTLIAILVVCILATSVTAYRSTDYYSINQTGLTLYDSFTRNTTSWDLGSADTNQTWWQETYGGGIDNTNHYQWVNGSEFIDYTNNTWFSTPYTGYDGITMTPTSDLVTFEWDYKSQSNGTPMYGFWSIDYTNSNVTGAGLTSAYFYINPNGTMACYSPNLNPNYSNATTFVVTDGVWHHMKLALNITTGQYQAYMDGLLICDWQINPSSWGDVITAHGSDGDMSFLFQSMGNTNAFDRTQGMDDLIGYSGVLNPYVPLMQTCFQDQANETSGCGLATGSYYYTDGWVTTGADIVDGNWTTGASLSWTNITANVSINYTKFPGVLNTSLWQIKDECNISGFNLSILTECWDSANDSLSFFVLDDQNYINYYCLNGSTPVWLTRCSNVGHNYMLYEEGVWWDYNPTCTPDWQCYGYEQCTNSNQSVACTQAYDANGCGQNYTGNLTEFSNYTCPCIQDWNCTTWDTCSMFEQQCVGVTDLGGCGQNYTGNYTEFGNATCGCPTDWVCNDWAACTNFSKECIGAINTTACDLNYTGDYSELQDQFCGNDTYTNILAFDDFNRNTQVVGNLVYPAGDRWVETQGFSETNTTDFVADGQVMQFNVAASTIGISYWGNDTGQTINIVGTQSMEFDLNYTTSDFFALVWGQRGGGYFAYPYMEYWMMDSGGGVLTNTGASWATSAGWHHYKITFNQTAGSVEAWVDGSPAYTAAMATDIIDTITIWSNGNTFAGQIDNFIYYNGTALGNCTPSWNCSLFASCVANVSNCTAVNDLNACGDMFAGNLSDYNVPCVMPTGYQPQYGSGDLASLTIDTFAQAVLEVIALVGLVVAVLVAVYAGGKIKKIGK